MEVQEFQAAFQDKADQDWSPVKPPPLTATHLVQDTNLQLEATAPVDTNHISASTPREETD